MARCMTARAAPSASAAAGDQHIVDDRSMASGDCGGQPVTGSAVEHDTKLLAGLVDTALGCHRDPRRVGFHREKPDAV